MKYQRLYPLYLAVALLIVLAQLFYLPIYGFYAPFWGFCLYLMLTAFTVTGCWAVVRGDIVRGHWWVVLSTTACVSLGCFIYGSYSGIEYYFFGLVSGTLVSALALRWRMGLMLLQSLVGIALVIYTSEVTPVVELPERFMATLRLVNWIDMSLFTVLIALAMTYFVDSLGDDADIDELTGAYNRRALIRHSYWLGRAKTDYAVLVFDLDHFKRINDTHGHALGDRVLKYFVAMLRKSSRKQDFIGRIGGEEFVMLLPELSRGQSYQVAERIRYAIATMPFRHGDISLTITTSIGIALSCEADTIEAVIAQADERLYQAKANGRDCIHSGDDATSRRPL